MNKWNKNEFWENSGQREKEKEEERERERVVVWM